MGTVIIQQSPADGASRDPLTHLLDAIGHDHFGSTLANYLHGLCGADHFAAFRLGQNDLREVAANCVESARSARDCVDRYVNLGLWKLDPAMTEAQRSMQQCAPTLIHVDFSHIGYTELRRQVYPHIRDRVLLCGRAASGAFGLSVLRADPHSPFGSENLRRLSEGADMLLTVLSKHAEFLQSRRNVAQALTVLSEIENCIAEADVLPPREAEVCARILYGLSSVGIALDLSIGEETVKTYRKRAYQRLNIGSERELLTWYLTRWSYWSLQRHELVRTPTANLH